MNPHNMTLEELISATLGHESALVRELGEQLADTIDKESEQLKQAEIDRDGALDDLERVESKLEQAEYELEQIRDELRACKGDRDHYKAMA